MDGYMELVGLPHYALQYHRPMSLYARASQFAPFAALTGFDEDIAETARLTDSQHSLTEDELNALNEALVWLLEHEAQRPAVRVTYFQTDAFKSGGAYVTYTGHLRFLDEAEGLLKFTDGTELPMAAIRWIERVED